MTTTEILKAKISHLVIENTPGERIHQTFVRTFATKPIGGLPYNKRGKIFGVIEIKSSHPEIPHLIDLIIEDVKNNYYYNEDIDQLPTVGEHFEAALRRTNLSIASFIESEQIELELEKVNIIIGASLNQEIHLAVIGNIGAFLFYYVSKNSFRIVNISDSNQVGNSLADPLKFFSQVISGKIRQRDFLFLSTSNILDYFSLESIKNIITEKEGDASSLEMMIKNTKSKENFAAISLRLEKLNPVVKKPVNIATFDYSRAASKDSINELIRTEKETEKLLTPSLLPELKKYAGSFKKAFSIYLEKTKSNTTGLYQKQKNLIKPMKPSLDLKIRNENLKKFGKGLRASGKLTFYQTRKMIGKIAQNKIFIKILDAINNLLGDWIKKFRKLPKSSKISFVVSMILVVFFVQSIIWINIKNQKTAKIERFNQMIVEITDKKYEAESSLIYRDEGQARQLLVESRDILNSLTPYNQEQEKQKEELAQEIEQKLQELRHIVTINDPIQIVNFKNLDSQSKISGIMVMNNDQIYTQNQSNQSIYKANIETRVMSSIFSPESNTGSLSLAAPINSNEIIFLNESQAAFNLNPNNDVLQNLTININDNSSIVGVATFNNRVYLLDKNNNQIYRYSKVGNGYGNATNWVTAEDVDFSEATSLTIDGFIYVLKADGDILRFQNGSLTEFKVTTIDPPLKSANKIKTFDGSKFLYFIDRSTNRVVVLDKEGSLVVQYYSELFDDLKDFSVNELTKEIYVLNNSSIYGISADHLN